MMECIDLIHKVVMRQETLEYLAMCGQGEWFLEENYAEQKIDERNFYRMSEEQRKKAFEKFYVLRPVRSSLTSKLYLDDPASGDAMCTETPCLISVAPKDTNSSYPFPKT